MPPRVEILPVVLRHFAATTTIGGLTQICNAPHRFLKSIWLLIFLAFTGLTAYNTYTVFLDYYNYPVLTYVSVKYERSLPFPAVTVCNLNPVPCSNLAVMFLKNMTKYNELFELSDCKKKVSAVPLIFKLVNAVGDSSNFTRRLRTALIERARILLSGGPIGKQPSSGGTSGGSQQGASVSNATTTPSPSVTQNGTQTANTSSSAYSTTTADSGGNLQPASGSNATSVTSNGASTPSMSQTSTSSSTAAGGALPVSTTAVTQATSSSSNNATPTIAFSSTTTATSTRPVETTTSQGTTTKPQSTSSGSLPPPTATASNNVAMNSSMTQSANGSMQQQTTTSSSSSISQSGQSSTTSQPMGSGNPPSSGGSSTPMVLKGLESLSLSNLITKLLAIQEEYADPLLSVEARSSFASNQLRDVAQGVLEAFIAETLIKNTTATNASSTTTTTTSTTTTPKASMTGPSAPGGSGPTMTMGSTAGGFGPRDLSSASDDYLKSETFTLRMAELIRTSRKEYEQLSKKFEEVILRCEFQGSTECLNSSWWMRTGDTEYGSCFTFNSAFNSFDSDGGARKVGVTGNRNGLTLEMLTSAQEYLPTSVANSEGLRVVIHDPSDRPNPADAGFNIRPNTVTDVAMKLLQTSRLASPYETNCSESWDQTFYQPMAPVIGAANVSTGALTTPVYTFGACQSMCETLYILKNCSCIDPHSLLLFLYKPTNQTIGDNERLCVYSDKDVTDYECVVAARNELQNNESLCTDCQLPCNDNIYELQISAATWPATGYIDVVAAKYQDSYNEVGAVGATKISDVSTMKEVIKNEFVKINVYFQTMNLQTIEEEPKYDIWGFLSSVGGAVGLYLGMCGVSLIELVELLFLVIIGACGVVWVRPDDDDKKPPVTGPTQEGNFPRKEPGKDMMDKMFRLTESARQLRERNVYPIKVPDVQQDVTKYPKPGSYLDPYSF